MRAQESGGNIFADLGLPNPEQELLKAQLTLQIYKIIKQRGLLGSVSSRLETNTSSAIDAAHRRR